MTQNDTLEALRREMLNAQCRCERVCWSGELKNKECRRCSTLRALEEIVQQLPKKETK